MDRSKSILGSCVLEWLSQSPDLNLFESMWNDLKRTVHGRFPCNWTDLEHFSKKEGNVLHLLLSDSVGYKTC